MSYATYVASGLVVTSAMFSGAFETTFSTFVRMRWQKTYDAMLSTHLRPAEIFTGELLFCGSIGALYSSIVTLVTLPLGARPTAWCLLVPLIGFATAYLFGSIGLIVTSFVKVMQNFNFFISGVISPMFFFAGTFFPVRGHNAVVDVIWFVLPLSHSVELSRALFRGQADSLTVWHVLTMLVYIVAAHTLAQRRMRGRVLG
jgi:lipooligosaccharide transport system permease protein